MRRNYLFTLLLPLLVLVSGCNNQVEEDLGVQKETRTLEFYALNDFHGSFLNDPSYKQTGLSKIGKFLKDKKQANPEDTFLLASGDMFQGGAESNITYGDVVIDSMNAIGFDSMTIGNHEFDWGEEALKNMQSKMNFPLLGYNIYYANTNNRPEYLKPSVVMKKEGIKVGIMGAVEPGIGDSILPTIAEKFSFPDQVEDLKNEARRLKERENCDIVVLSTHDGNSNLYYDLSEKFNETETYVDAVFLGHEHDKIKGTLANDVPFIQGGCNGNYISNVSLELKLEGKHYRVVNSTSENIYTYGYLKVDSPEVNAVYEKYKLDIEKVRDEVLFTFDTAYTKVEFGRFISYALVNYVNNEKLLNNLTSCLGVINKRGVRSDIPKGEFTYGDLIKAYPFENALCVLKINENQLSLYEESTQFYTYRSVLTHHDGFYYVSTIDYVAYQKSLFKEEIISFQQIRCRDIIANTLKTKGFQII